MAGALRAATLRLGYAGGDCDQSREFPPGACREPPSSAHLSKRLRLRFRFCPRLRLRFRLRPRPDSLGATAPTSGRSWGAASGSAHGGRSGRVAPVGEPLRWECGVGRPSAAGGGDEGPAAWVRAARSFRPAPAPGRGRVSGGPASGAWAPRAGAGTAGPASPVIRGQERPPPPPPRPADFPSPALPLPAQPRVASAAEAKGSSAQDS